MKKVFFISLFLLFVSPNQAFSATTFLRLTYCDYLSSGSSGLSLRYVRINGANEKISNVSCEANEATCRPNYVVEISGATFIIDSFGSCSSKLPDSIDCNLIAGSCPFSDNGGNTDNGNNGDGQADTDIAALLAILQGLPDQIMAVLLAYLTFKTFLDMVK